MPDLIQFECPSCAAVLRIPLEMGGVEAACPLCQEVIIAPDPETGIGAHRPGPPASLELEPPAAVEPEPEPETIAADDFAAPANSPFSPSASPFADTTVRTIAPKSISERTEMPAYRKIEPANPFPPRIEKEQSSDEPFADSAADSAEAEEPIPSPPSRKGKMFLACLITAIVCLAGEFFVLKVLMPQPEVAPLKFPVNLPRKIEPAPAAAVPPVATPAKEPAKPVESGLEKAPEKPAGDPAPPIDKQLVIEGAKAVLKAFLEAPGWEARSAYVLSPEAVRPKMEAYARNSPDGPTTFESFSLKHSQVDEKTGSTLYVFQVNSPAAPDGIPVAILETPGGWLVDWESFVEFRDHRFKQFTEGPSDLVGSFHLIVSNPPASAQENENFAGFLLAPPPPDAEKKAFVQKSNPAYAVLKTATANGRIFTPVLEITKRSLPNGQSYLEILSIKATDWRPHN